LEDVQLSDVKGYLCNIIRPLIDALENVSEKLLIVCDLPRKHVVHYDEDYVAKHSHKYRHLQQFYNRRNCL